LEWVVSEAVMSGAPAGEITVLLRAWSDGDDDALTQLIPLVYRELYRAAQRYMAHQEPGHILQNTALVNEVYLRLAAMEPVRCNDRNHFFAICAKSMRYILVDHARSQLCQKRGGGAQHLASTEAAAASEDRNTELLAIHEALDRLAAVDKRKSQVFELRYFGGLSVKEAADVLKVSEDTVMRDWRFVKHWLLSELGGEHADRRRTLAKA
jgi:RNA polymerase sigma-70 factor, ECF subfamily